jgi:hypothetical protein
MLRSSVNNLLKSGDAAALLAPVAIASLVIIKRCYCCLKPSLPEID